MEYPTTRILGAPAADRARDLHAAFADPDIKAVLAVIGGDDQITVVPPGRRGLPREPEAFLRVLRQHQPAALPVA